MYRQLIIALLFVTSHTVAQQVGSLQCEQLTDPLGIDNTLPRLSWQLTGDQQGLHQIAYQVLIASSAAILAKDSGDLWNTGKVTSDQSRMITYAGKPLHSRAACYWKVRVWTSAGTSAGASTGASISTNTAPTAWSPPAHWTIGLLSPTDWSARFIGYDHGFPWDSISKFSRLSARYFRKQFTSPQKIKRATLYIAGLGHYEAAINGKPVGDQVLAESPTDYTREVRYNTFDVTGLCRQGSNAIGVTLGNGRFFTMRPKYKPQKIKEFGFPKLLLQLEIEDEAGNRKTILSDTTWKFTADGPIRTNNEYDGEEYDATKEFPGWSLPGFDDSRWLMPQQVDPPGGRLVAQSDEPLKIMTTIRPMSVKELRPGTWIMDMGQNMAGWVQLKVKGRRGQQVTLRYAETLQKDGSLYTANLRDAKVTDSYTLKGGGEETWHPIFVFHGFRYVSISDYPGTPRLQDFEGQVVYDAMPTIGEFHTSDPLLDHIYKNAWWGINANYKGMPVDCPQRNERMPWLGDRATGSLGESYLFDNECLYAKWLDDIEDSQRPDGALPDVAPAYWNYYTDNITWPATYILVAEMLYRQFADRRPIEQHYRSMKKWLYYMSGKYGNDGLITKDKYGDWCVPPESPELIHSRDSLRNTDGVLIATAYYYHLLGLMEHFATLLGLPDDAAAYDAAAVKTKIAFNRTFLHEGYYSNNTVTANLLPLYFGMVPPESRASVFTHIVSKIEKDNNGHISTGVIGTQWLMRGLTEYGRADLACRIAMNKDYPSWGYMVQHGATTIWELWNGDSANPAMNSQNHIMLLGDLLTWCYQDLAGIAPAQPGFQRLRMAPVFPERLTFVQASYRTPYGPVTSSWKREAGSVSWDITLPPNTSATVVQPDGKTQDIGSGHYHFNIAGHPVTTITKN